MPVSSSARSSSSSVSWLAAASGAVATAGAAWCRTAARRPPWPLPLPRAAAVPVAASCTFSLPMSPSTTLPANSGCCCCWGTCCWGTRCWCVLSGGRGGTAAVASGAAPPSPPMICFCLSAQMTGLPLKACGQWQVQTETCQGPIHRTWPAGPDMTVPRAPHQHHVVIRDVHIVWEQRILRCSTRDRCSAACTSCTIIPYGSRCTVHVPAPL